MRKTCLLFLLACFALNLFSQVHWTKYPDNPVMLPGQAGDWDEQFIAPGAVIYYDSTYHMWYTGGISVGHAYSQDGITWTKDTNNPVLNVGQPGDWDENSLGCGGVLVIDSIFHMWYTGHTGSIINENYRIGHATSLDGINWTKDANNPILDKGPDGSWDDAWISGGSVLHNGSEYHIWYTGWGGGPEEVRFGHATSPDGVNWSKDSNNPVLSYESGKWDNPRVDMPNVVFDGTTYHMWYSGGELFSWQIGYATSTDGSSWTKHANNPVLLKGSPGAWDAKSVAWCSVIDSSNVKYKMWYSGVNSSETGCIGYAESSPYVEIPDTAFLYALIEEGVDTNGDSLISYLEAEAVTSLIVGDWSEEGTITDMTGLEAFLNLEILYCQNNEFDNIDVSNNTALMELYCSSNQLSSLDVSNNNALEILNCWDNQTSSLDVSSCTNLSELYCSSMQLTNLDVSKNAALEVLFCHKNQLTSLDVSKNSTLEELYCYENQLTSLDLTNNSLLKVLHCGGNLLTSLDISNNQLIGTYIVDDWWPDHFDLYLNDMPTLGEVCVWESIILSFVGFDRNSDTDSVCVDTTGSPNVCFQTDCNGDCSVVGINDFQESKISIYPNPTYTQLTIETVTLDLFNIKITSLNGQLILSRELEGNNCQLDLSSFQKGIYIITIRSKDFVTTRKIVKL